MIPKNYAECPVCGKNRIRVNRSYIYAYIRCDSCKSEGWEHEFPTIFGKKEEQQEKEPLKAAKRIIHFDYREEIEKWQGGSRRNSYDKFGQKKDGRHL